jgi:DNA-binding response OmpR family regulator
MKKILVVEDDPDLLALVKYNLETVDFRSSAIPPAGRCSTYATGSVPVW